jgi:hypothetical protein
MTTRLLHLPARIHVISWSQIEFGVLAAMCVLGYASALTFAIS